MIIPFIPEDLFELNNNIQPKFNKEIIITKIFLIKNNLIIRK